VVAEVRRRIAVVCRQSPGDIDAIRDHSYRLAEALRARGADVDVHMRTPGHGWLVDPGGAVRPRLAAGLGAYDAALIQYNPFMWGRWGFAPWLPFELARLRARRPRPLLVLVLHEPFVPMEGWRWTLMGLWQRAQLAAVRATADIVFVSIEIWTRRFMRWHPRRPTFHLPVGSNLPDRSASRRAERERLGAGDDDLVVAIVDVGGAARRPALVTAALERLVAGRRRIVLLVLGAGAAPPPGIPPGVDVRVPGRLDAASLAAALASADLFLAPFVDGVSTRRTSLMAALQHGVAIVGTDGDLTDSLLRESSALVLVPVDRPDLFAAAAARVADDPAERAVLARDGRELYREQFDWPTIARRVIERLAEPSPA
jgi:glycosyltransferase involved in cell wall biosynthesis